MFDAEWARTHFARQCFGQEPTILRLEPLDAEEQAALFARLQPTTDFAAFHREVERFDLAPLLGNPKFLRLLADAYEEGGHRFSTKRRIYVDALRRLARERSDRTSRGRPSIDRIVDVAAEVFATLLLAGATGVSAREEVGQRAYPFSG